MYNDFKISKNKCFSYQIEVPNPMDDFFEFKLAWTDKEDHAGLYFTFGIKYLFWMNFSIHDWRHWDYDNNEWQKIEGPPSGYGEK